MSLYTKIRNDRKKKYNVRFKDPVTGKDSSVANFKTKKECDQFYLDYKESLHTNRFKDQEDLTLRQFVDMNREWIMNGKYKSINNAKNTLRVMDNIVLPKLGDRGLNDISVVDWEKIFNDMNTSRRLFLKEDHKDKQIVPTKIKKKIRRENIPTIQEFVEYFRSEVCMDPQKHRRKCPGQCYEAGYKNCMCSQELKDRVEYEKDDQGRFILCNQITLTELSQLSGVNRKTLVHWRDSNSKSLPSADHWRKIYPYLKLKRYPIDIFDLEEVEAAGRSKVVGTHVADEPYTYGYIQKVRNIVCVFYRRAMNLELSDNPTIFNTKLPNKQNANIKKSIHQRHREIWEESDVKYFLDYLADQNTLINDRYDLKGYDRDYFAYFLYTRKGLRRSELPPIELNDVVIQEDGSSYIKIQRQVDTSNSLGRKAKYDTLSVKGSQGPNDYDIIGLDHKETEQLKDHIDLMSREKASNPDYPDHNYLFAMEDGSLISYDYFSKKFNRLVKKLEILPKISLHGLRHSLATRLMREGKSKEVVQARMRHKNYKTTEAYYIHESDEALQEKWIDEEEILHENNA